MLIVFLIIISYVLVILNFGAPVLVSNTPDMVLLLEHTGVLASCFMIIDRVLKGCESKHRYNICFLVSYCISLLIMKVTWGPQLVCEFTTGWGAFDPIKYYSMAASAINQGVLDENFFWFPVAFIYYGIMRIFGLNPLVPLFFNEIVFVYAVVILARYVNGKNTKYVKYYSLLLLIPELMYYNVTSSKDIICLFSATVIFVKASEFIRDGLSLKRLLILLGFFLIFVLARASLSFASVFGIILINVLSKKLSKRSIALMAASGVFIVAAFTFSSRLGGNADAEGTTSYVSKVSSGNMSVAAEMEGVNPNGFSQKLIPHNSVQFVVYGFIRSICYVIIDGRFVTQPFNILGFNSVYSMVDWTSLIMFIYCFYILKWLRRTKIGKRETYEVRATLIMLVLYWYIVGAFNPLMIHVRYRLVYDLLFFAIAIRAYLYCSKNVVKKRINGKGC